MSKHQNSQLHLHSIYSAKDGIIEASELVEWCKEHDAYAVATTDHGNGQSFAEFAQTFKKAQAKNECNTKYIPGIEMYCKFELGEREHLIVLPYDDTGFTAMVRCITETNRDITENDGYPIATEQMLREFFGPKSAGHGHVAATSACIQGPIGAEFLINSHYEKEACKLEKRMDKLEFDEVEYNKLTSAVEEGEGKLSDIIELRQALNTLKNKPYKKKVKALEKLTGDERAAAEQALNAEKKESEEAAIKLPSIKEQEAEIRSDLSEKKAVLKKMETKAEKIEELKQKAAEERAKKRPFDFCKAEAVKKTEMMIDIFGKENFYAELQYHGIQDEERIYPVVADIAATVGIKMIASNDAHMIDGSTESRKKRQIVRSMRFNQWEEEQVGDEELYVKDDEQLRNALLQILPSSVVDEAIAEKERLAEKCNAVIKEGKHYPVYPIDPRSTKTSEDILKMKIKEGMSVKFPNKTGWNKTYRDRVMYEMDVIKKLGVIDYLLIVADFLEYGRLVGKIDTKDPEFLKNPFNIKKLRAMAEGKVGMGIGIGRGSGAGSLVCYLLDITDVDPIKYNLLFERFLNPDRVSMPDIDSDLAPEVREWTIAYVKNKYGENAVCGVMTLEKMAAKGSIRTCARLLSSKLYGKETVLFGLGSEICAELPSGPDVNLLDYEGKLRSKFGDNPEAMEIIDDAIITEGCCSTTGQHAAGIVIADNGDVREYLPLMKSKDGKWITQYDKKYIEKIGLLKFDFLGLITLAIISDTLRFIKENHGVSIEANKIPLDDKTVYHEIFAKGNTGSVFQFESEGMKKLLRNLKPDKIEDLILLNALYRPGPLQNADKLCEAKKNPDLIPKYICKEIKPILDTTYGYPVYQEQVMQICNKAAGFTLAEADNVRKCMSKKMTEELLSYEDKFVNGLIEHGASEKDAKDFWQQLVAFGSYAFNKSHSAAYAITAYYTGWLKYYYPTEYFAAVLNYSDFDDLTAIMADAKNYGIKIELPNINQSRGSFVPDKKKKSILYGLAMIKGVASYGDLVAEKRTALYKSFTDFDERVKAPKDVTKNLILSGTFDVLKPKDVSIDVFRNNLLTTYDSEEKTRSKTEILFEEKSLIGAFLSSDPTADYTSKNKISEIGDNKKYLSIIGVVTEYKKKITKSGKEMATFTFSDNTGSVSACCFATCYEQYKELLGDNKILQIEGYEKQDGDFISFIVQSVSVPSPTIKEFIFITSEEYGADYFASIVKDYKDPNGIPVKVQVKSSIIPFSSVNKNILTDERAKSKIIIV